MLDFLKSKSTHKSRGYVEITQENRITGACSKKKKKGKPNHIHVESYWYEVYVIQISHGILFICPDSLALKKRVTILSVLILLCKLGLKSTLLLICCSILELSDDQRKSCQYQEHHYKMIQIIPKKLLFINILQKVRIQGKLLATETIALVSRSLISRHPPTYIFQTHSLRYFCPFEQSLSCTV